VGIVGCLLAFAAFGRMGFGTGSFETVMVTLGVLTHAFLGERPLGGGTQWWASVSAPGW
jgi:hypothetical protein